MSSEITVYKSSGSYKSSISELNERSCLYSVLDRVQQLLCQLFLTAVARNTKLEKACLSSGQAVLPLQEQDSNNIGLDCYCNVWTNTCCHTVTTYHLLL